MDKKAWEKKRIDDPNLPSWEDKLLIDESIAESSPAEMDPVEAMDALLGEKRKENDMVDLARWQYSIFTNGREGQFVIRSNDFEEFIDLKKKLDTIVPKAPARVDPPVKDDLTSTCKTHTGVPTQQGFSKKTGKPYWYHDGTNGEGRCFGNGFLPSNR